MTDTQRQIYSVSQLNHEANNLLNTSFPLLWVEGELSNIARPASGHLYFTLKDSKAQVRCAMFRNRNMQLRFQPTDGLQVLVRARVGLYENRGDFQLSIEHMEEAGSGALQRAYEELKHRLAAEGLFDETHKQDLPRFPRQVGVITSPTGAAIRDILSVLKRRFPALPVIIYPVPVQGDGAAAKIADALARAAARNECDVLILARGGGSLEDLWAFNEEVVARAVAASPIPVVCGVGHEVDVSIADFAADRRAATPSAAAELITPDQSELRSLLDDYAQGFSALLNNRLAHARQRLQWLQGRLQQQHPQQRLQQHALRLDDLEQRMRIALRLSGSHARSKLNNLDSRLLGASPAVQLANTVSWYQRLQQRLHHAMEQDIRQRGHTLEQLMHALNTVSPLATLERGYSITTRKADNALLRSTDQVQAGEDIGIRLAKGSLTAKVEKLTG